MRILILYVHPRKEGFCRQLLRAVQSSLEEDGHELEIADLYAEGFNPAMTADDFAQFARQPMPPDVVREQARIERNDTMIVVTPIWWYQFPAMLKGWIDRVFSEGWAFADSHSRDTPPTLRIRRVLVMASAGGRPGTYEKYGYRQALQALWDTGIWGYCGIEATTRFFWDLHPRQMLDSELQRHLERAREIARQFADVSR